MNVVDSSLLDEGNPAFDQRAFRRDLGQFATGVTVITTRAGEELFAVTANSFSSVSLDPPMILWSLRKESRNLPAFQQSDRFAINILAADQIELASHFSRSTTDKFGSRAWREGIGGIPLINEAAAQFECRRAAQYEAGDHIIFLGEVEYFRCFDRVGLLFAQGRYALALDHPGTPADLPLQVPAHPRDDFFLPLLVRSYAYLSGAFAEHHDAEGVNTNQSRVLAFLATRAGASAEVIARMTFLGEAAVEDAVARLLSMGWVSPRPPGTLAITKEGLEAMHRIIARAHQFEEEQLADVDPADVAAARRVLLALASRGER
jgi:4-hydroxyphenylacetate 3-hydroxylase, reductase component